VLDEETITASSAHQVLRRNEGFKELHPDLYWRLLSREKPSCTKSRLSFNNFRPFPSFGNDFRRGFVVNLNA
jgi:hypothetical protein